MGILVLRPCLIGAHSPGCQREIRVAEGRKERKKDVGSSRAEPV